MPLLDGAPDPGLNTRHISSSTLELGLEIAPVDGCRVCSIMFDNDAAAFELFKIVLFSPIWLHSAAHCLPSCQVTLDREGGR